MDWNSDDSLRDLVNRLRALPKENEWLEFKVGNTDPEEIGQYISCLANSAALAGQETAFLLWGIHDETHEIVGTSFQPEIAKKSNEELLSWLTRLLDPNIDFSFHRIDLAGKNVVVMRVEAASNLPVKFKNSAYIRIGSYKKPLSSHREHERRLWKVLDAYSIERGVAASDLTVDHVVQLLDYPAYFELHKVPLPESRSAIVEALEASGLIRHNVSDQWQITNVGALLYARDLEKFPRLARKATRVIHYAGVSRIKAKKEQLGKRGYAVGFQGLLTYIEDQLPNSEVILDGIRMDELQFPRLAI